MKCMLPYTIQDQCDADHHTVLKVGRVAIITRGRYAGKKVRQPPPLSSPPSSSKHPGSQVFAQVVIIQPFDTGSKSHPFPHALVVGIERYPGRVTRRMGETRRAKSTKLKPFIKTVNYNHLMPTRYTLELEGLKTVVSHETFKETSQREEAKKTVKKTLEERYSSGKNKWFFTPLSETALMPVVTLYWKLTLGRVLRHWDGGRASSSDSWLRVLVSFPFRPLKSISRPLGV